MRRLKIKVAYDGTNFHGWQVQPGLVTIQGELERILGEMEGKPVKVHGSGRTDAGVHALEQVAAFSFENPIPPANLRRAVNRLLPPAIRIVEAREVHAGFHPRFDARARRYRYTLYNRPLRSPLASRYAWQVWPELDLAVLQAASATLLGRHNFAAFGSPAAERGGSTFRTVSLAEWHTAPGPAGWLTFDIQAESFLFRMVRSLVGALKRAGSGELTTAQFEAILASGDRAQCPPIAPPQGLCLMEVLY